MQILTRSAFVLLTTLVVQGVEDAGSAAKKKHHHKHHGHHKRLKDVIVRSAPNANRSGQVASEQTPSDKHIVERLKKLEREFGRKVEPAVLARQEGSLEVASQSGDPKLRLGRGPLPMLLENDRAGKSVSMKRATAGGALVQPTPVQEKGFDVDTEMPYGELEPFGREDTAQELTENSVRESDEMVDQLERAEVAEEKRAVFRALTRLRGAAITSFDGVARSQTGNLDGYSKTHKWRVTHPLHHLADEESDISKWAFPDNADFF